MPSVVVQAGDVGSGAATVKVYAADGTTLATVYKDANGDDTGANPLPKHKATGYFGLDNAGNFTVYLVPGDYQLGVTPAGGSETKTPFTVVAPVVEVETVFTEVFGTPADGDVPAWNDTTKRFEWAPAPAASGARSAAYETNGYAGQPTFALVTARPHDADGVDIAYSEPDPGVVAPRFTFLTDGLYSITYYAEGESDTAYMGAYLQFWTAADVAVFPHLSFGAESKANLNDGQSASTTTVIAPFVAGEYFVATLYLDGITQNGTTQQAKVLVSRLG